MTGSEVFRSVFLGGYHKADVDEYIQTVERQIESVKAAHQKEQNDLIQKYEERLLEKTALLENAENRNYTYIDQSAAVWPGFFPDGLFPIPLLMFPQRQQLVQKSKLQILLVKGLPFLRSQAR